MKNQILKKILILIILSSLSILLYACNSEETLTGREDNKESPQITLDFWHHYSAQSPENEILTNVLIPKFEEENKGYKINAVSHDWADLHDKFIISASSGMLPDVGRLDITWLPEFVKMDILVPLDKEISEFESVSSELLENALNTAKIGDHYYALPLNTNTKILFVNKTAFNDNDIQIPSTMQEMLEVAKKLSGKNPDGKQIWGLCEPALSGWNVLPYIWSFGGDITDETYTKASGYVNSPETVEAINMLKELYKADALTGFNSGDIPMTDGFGTGRYMMIIDGPWKIAELKGSYPDFQYETADVPSGKGGSVSVLGGENIGMLKGGNQEGAWAFMKFMTGSFAQEEMAKAGQIPVNKAALQSNTVKNAPFAPFLDAITKAKIRPPIATWSEVDNELSIAITKILTEDADTQKTLDELAIKLDALLADK
ncbi:extracellular solute-binding protein [Thermoanaerobacter pentosaceus]|uniref:Multiple sugar transport system substrate-binding protein n=1 Tax=Thermoanaerobacter pentosaceus TaxID=694059 RepID=A0ABT9M6M0_9THEO|nr:extracellular solute-binding protein [Thermoanaerobacter pentosaceus]MDP9751763.1 multiple sugar transport system substrate-binding protein [Thermoanaerobacter pentosaceus]